MNGKLVRNTSDKESRDWWKAIDAAASTAPELTDKPAPQTKAPAPRAESKPAGSRSRKK